MLWLRWTLANDTVAIRFVMAKTFEAPLKRKSIPRLELMAAIIMSRLAKFLEDCLGGIESNYFWVDSQTVLTSASADFKPSVSARAQEIHDTLHELV